MKKKSKKKSFQKRTQLQLEKYAVRTTGWLGSIKSLLVHTVLFLVCFIIPLFGVPLDRVLLALTTILSLEAIYLAIFIQMSVNKNTADIEDIQEDMEDIAEDIEEISVDVDEIQKDVDEIQEDVEGIQEDVDEIQEDIEEIEEDSEEDVKIEKKEIETLTSIQNTLAQLQKEIELLKKKE